jgi:hypothetical protein
MLKHKILFSKDVLPQVTREAILVTRWHSANLGSLTDDLIALDAQYDSFDFVDRIYARPYYDTYRSILMEPPKLEYERLWPDMKYTPINITYLECKNSRNSPKWKRVEVPNRRLLEIRTFKHMSRRPKQLTYRPPTFYSKEPIYKEPKFRGLKYRPKRLRETNHKYEAYKAKVSMRFDKHKKKVLTLSRLSFDRRYKKWVIARDKFKAAKKLYDAQYLLRKEKYKKRLDKYLELTARLSKPYFKRQHRPSLGNLPDNPYGLLRLVPHESNKAPVSAVQTVFMQYYSFQAHFARNPWWYIYKWLYRVDNIFLSKENMLSPTGANYLERARKTAFTLLEPLVKAEEPRLIRKIYSKMAGKSAHIGNIIAERKQTVDLFAKTVTTIVDLVKAKKHLFRAAAKAVSNPKNVADQFLAFKFGLEPLANDLSQLTDIFLDLADMKPVLVIRSNTKKFLTSGDETPGIVFNGMMEISYVLKYDIDDAALKNLSQLGLINPTEIAWEVVPWSFIVDWFLPIGAYIESLTADSGLIFRTGTKKVRYKGDFDFGTVPQVGQMLNPQGQHLCLQGKFSGELIDREVLMGPPDNLKILTVKNPWSLNHALEAAALAIQKLKR